MSARSTAKEWVSPEWAQRGFNALQETFDVHPELKRDMIQFLYDSGFWDEKELAWTSALTRFNACLNPKRPEAFKLAELWALMKRFERFRLFEAMAADLGFELRRVPSEERRQVLLDTLATQLRRSNDLIHAALDQLRAEGAEPPLVIHPAFAEGRGAFALPEPDSGSSDTGVMVSF